MSRLPQRIVCLTTETVDVLYALGEQERIAGITGYTARPPQARKEKPKVYAFTSGDIDSIVANPLEVVERAPEVIISSWCGKHFRHNRVSGHSGWSTVPAVVNGRLHEIKSAIILTPGPVAISEGLPLLRDILDIDVR
jgi:ABC-type Fe3+-hydroxamate transport system substrate-binding protein